METGVPDLVLLDLGLGGSTTIGVDICRNIFKRYPDVHVLIFTGEILNELVYIIHLYRHLFCIFIGKLSTFLIA